MKLCSETYSDGVFHPVDLKRQAIHLGIIASLVKKFAVGKHHEVRMDLICLDILGMSEIFAPT